MDENKNVKCFECGLTLAEKERTLIYLGREFSYKILCCQKCGQVFVPEELAKGRMKQVEMMLEGK